MDSITAGTEPIIVSGWAYDPDSLGTSIAVHVYVGGSVGTGVGYATTANVSRTDVNTAFGISGNQKVYVYAINNKSGNNPLIGSKTVTITGNSSPAGYLESAVGNAGSLTVSGWAYDSDSSGTSIAVHIYV